MPSLAHSIGYKPGGALSVTQLASEWKMLDTVCSHLVRQMASKCIEWSSVLELMRTRLERLWIGTGAAMMQHERQNEQMAAPTEEAATAAPGEEVVDADGGAAATDALAAQVATLRLQLAEAEAKLAARGGDGRGTLQPEALRAVAAKLIAQADAAEQAAAAEPTAGATVDATTVPAAAQSPEPASPAQGGRYRVCISGGSNVKIMLSPNRVP